MGAFSGSAQGRGLPERFSPWLGVGVIRNDQVPPHGFAREEIEAGIAKNGYQLWRNKKSTGQAKKASGQKGAVSRRGQSGT